MDHSATGVICEYNPFHNGHAYHLREARKRSGSSFIICVMSGSFTQRGAIAVVDPLSRARAALMNGADVVLELPVLFAVRDARAFARGGVALLDLLGVCQSISFGCESEEELRSAAASDENDPIVLQALRDGLDRGESWARARGLVNLPNVILGVEYLRALTERGSDMLPLPIPRAAEKDGVTSASHIRKMMSGGESPEAYIPSNAFDALMDARAMRREDGLDALLLGMIRSTPVETIRDAVDVSEGLENRIHACSFRAFDRVDLIERVKCKRYTYARISRALTQTMLGITKRLAVDCHEPRYARLLGFRETARPLLKLVGDRAAIPIIGSAAGYRRHDDPAFALDLRADAIASLACTSREQRRGDHMLTDRIVIIK